MTSCSLCFRGSWGSDVQHASVTAVEVQVDSSTPQGNKVPCRAAQPVLWVVAGSEEWIQWGPMGAYADCRRLRKRCFVFPGGILPWLLMPSRQRNREAGESLHRGNKRVATGLALAGIQGRRLVGSSWQRKFRWVRAAYLCRCRPTSACTHSASHMKMALMLMLMGWRASGAAGAHRWVRAPV